jgi:hypothetical protein
MNRLVAFDHAVEVDSDGLSAAWDADSHSAAVQAGQVGMATCGEALLAAVQITSSLVARLDFSTVIEAQRMRLSGTS